MTVQVYHLRVFADGLNGGNPLPLICDAAGMTDDDLQKVAATFGHESCFVFPAPNDSDCDFEFRFWVPEHEMEMCGHATIGAVWFLDKLHRLPRDHVRIKTKSGIVEANMKRREGVTWVKISQGRGLVNALSDSVDVHEEMLSVLGIRECDLAPGIPIQNAQTSRVKTAIPLISVDVLNALRPRFERVKQLCECIGSTGLYPYAAVPGEGSQVFSARQFPKNSGYKEDVATGIAASALAFALLENGLVGTEGEVTIKQGQAMGAPSKISIQFRKDCDGHIDGCWIGGTAMLVNESH